ncbi:MAC/perforin domain-containing protein [Corallococcus sp. EGB]|uniref:MAC/perforin domain-containing protein n=1 Tax=Corallococcus sp. EGB TaxID=1521117 RepID=UPI001CBB5CB0|nr:MAC/perforin domain-containing protein [Corallococcus sp. EGB]
MAETMQIDFNKFDGTVPYKNIDFLGRCYDIIRINPLDLSQRIRDGGGATTESIIQISPESCTQLTPDRSLYIPEGTTYLPESRGERTSRTQTWFSSFDFAHSFEHTVSAGLDVPGLVSFSASIAYRQLEKTSGSNETIETFVQSYFEDCSIQLNDNFPQKLPLSSRLTSAVAKLTSESDCAEFIKTFGTHYAHEVTFGGRMYQRIHIKAQEYSKLVERGVDISTSASATYQGATASTGSSTSTSSSSAFKQSSGLTIDSIQWVGGTPNTDFDEWVKTIRQDPKPLQLDLRPLYELFTAAHFPNVPDLQKKKTWMVRAVDQHLRTEGFTRPDVSSLANKEFYFRSRWRADPGEKRINMSLGFVGEDVKLYPETNTTDLVPWKLIPVPGKTDEFYIRSRWRADLGEKRLDFHLSFTDDALKLYHRDNTADLVPWKFIPVPGKSDEYYIRSRWQAEKGDRRTDKSLGFYGNDGSLYGKDDYYNLVPWKLEPAAG